MRTLRTLGLGLLLAAAAMPLAAAPHQSAAAGKIYGVVVDPAGVPQMGAVVVVVAERVGSVSPLELLTNERGRFLTSSLLPGLYSVRVTMAGFLPAMEKNIRVTERRTTRVEIALGSVFSSLNQLRRQPNQSLPPPDEWSWVLRTASDTRPVLRWQDGEVLTATEASRSERARQRSPRGRVEVTSGSRRPGSVSNLADSPSTAFAYEQRLPGIAKLLMAGQFGYESASPSGGFGAAWLPAGDAKGGPVTTVIARESRLGPYGPTFRGVRLAQDGQMSVGGRIAVRYGVEYVVAGLAGTAGGLRPRAEVALEIAEGWLVSASAATRPWRNPFSAESALESALDSLDSMPTLTMRNGRPVLEDGLHEEIALEHTFSPRTSLTTAIFRDRSNHTAVFGQGNPSGPDFLPDFFSNAFVYDGGPSSSWGGRIAIKQRLNGDVEALALYAWGGALAPTADTTTGTIRDALETRKRQALAWRISGRVPYSASEVAAGYKWLRGPAVSRVDVYGESLYHLDPYLNLTVRQPLPNFIPGHLVAMADFGNLLAQGYVPIQTRDGKIVLVPAYRSFRGGVSLQF